VTTNRIEGFWAGLKRQLHGTHHSVSRKHLRRYVSEVEFKNNSRHLTDGERTVKLIQACDNRRLTYRQQADKNRDPKVATPTADALPCQELSWRADVRQVHTS
jgi:hypothetical protein